MDYRHQIYPTCPPDNNLLYLDVLCQDNKNLTYSPENVCIDDSLHFDPIFHRTATKQPINTSTNNLKLAYTNTDILSNKLEEVEIFLKDNHVDILSITEVNDKFTRTQDGNSFVISGYNYIECSVGRGVGMFMKNDLVFKRCSEYELLFKPSIFGILSLPDKTSVTLGLVYRSPNCDKSENDKFLNQIDVISSKFLKSNNKLVIMGDFNFKEIDWKNECCNTVETHDAYKFLSITLRCYLTQFVQEPTHHRALQTPSLIDLILSNDPEYVQNLVHHPPFGKSHHSVLTFSIDCKNKVPTNKTTTKFQIEKGDYDSMRKEVGDIKWTETLLQDENVNVWWDNIEGVLEDSKHKYIPKKSFKSTQPKRTFAAPFTLLQKLQRK